jgi:uncharacterized protein (DUF4415 family)
MNKSIDNDDWYPTDTELTQFRPISEADPALLEAYQKGTLKRRGRPMMEDKKRNISIRIDPDVINAYRATGQGWQSRINALLRDHMPT